METRWWLCAALLVAAGARAQGQQVEVQIQVADKQVAAEPAGRRPAGNMAGGVLLQENRELRRKLELLQQRINGMHFAEAARNLGALLEDPATGDFFLTPDASQRSRRNFKAEVRRLIGSLPPEGRKAYEDHFGPEARRQLIEAVRQGDLNLLQQVALRYSHTQAGQEALYLLAQDHQDHGRLRESAACLAWLRESPEKDRFEPFLSLHAALGWLHSGDEARAVEILAALHGAAPRTTWQVGGKPLVLFSDPKQAGQWLAQHFPPARLVRAVSQEGWLTHRGNAARNAAFKIDDPFMTARKREPLLSESGRSAVEREAQMIANNKAAPLPLLFPVAVEDTILVRTGNGVRAFDWTTGSEIWAYPSEDFGSNAGIEESVYRDAAFGSLSTDGQRVFVIKDQGMLPGEIAGMQPGMGGVFWARKVGFRGPFGPFPSDEGDDSGPLPNYNTLSAITILRQGSLEWQTGGVDGGDEPGLAGHFFLGPPLPYAGRLYCLAEHKSSIRLIVLDARTGRLAWLQELGVAEHGIAADPFRRMAGATPSIAQGVIICPTSAGCVVALDLATQSLLWAYQYPRNPQTRLNPESGQYPRVGQGNRWVDGSAVVSGAFVLLTPLESNEIHCLNLADGQLLWTQPRADNLFLAGVYDDRVALVGQHRVVFLDLKSGKPHSTQVSLPPGARPSGCGVQSGEFYYLPLSNHAIAKIDLAKGAVAGMLTSERGLTPGNLIVHRGGLISQSATSLEIFDPTKALQSSVQSALAADPNDPQALLRLAELELTQGKLAEAIEHFRKAHRLQPTARTRNRLMAALHDGIQQKLPGHKELEAELDKLLGL